MGYSKELLVSEMRELNLFDNVPYKYIKDFIDCDDGSYIEVEIEDLPCDFVACCKTKFTFKLNVEVVGCLGMPTMVDKKFTYENTWNTSSPYALLMGEYCCEDSEDEDNDDDDDDDDDDDSPKCVINYYICKKCGETCCVYLFQEKNLALALEKAAANKKL